MRTSRRLTVLGSVAVGAGLLLAAPAWGATVAVSAVDNSFQVAAVTVAAGDTVVFTNTGQRAHTVTADDGSFDSGTLTNGQSFSRTFTAPGTYAFYCTFHGGRGGQGMAGTVTVTAAAATTTTAAPAATATTAAPAAPATTTTTAAGATSQAPAQLPRTGASTWSLVLIGTGLVLVGLGALGARPARYR